MVLQRELSYLPLDLKHRCSYVGELLQDMKVELVLRI